VVPFVVPFHHTLMLNGMLLHYGSDELVGLIDWAKMDVGES
jgi:hypothetical protein